MTSWFDLDFSGKTVAFVCAAPNEQGIFTDLLISFTDGSSRQIGASKEGALVCCADSDLAKAAPAPDQRRCSLAKFTASLNRFVREETDRINRNLRRSR